MAGPHNDISVPQRCLVFGRIGEVQTPECNYESNGHQYNKRYYLDGIYPRWPTFMKKIRNPVGHKNSHFAKNEESAKKDVEWTFGMIQACFAIIRYPAQTWSLDQM